MMGGCQVSDVKLPLVLETNVLKSFKLQFQTLYFAHLFQINLKQIARIHVTHSKAIPVL